MSLPPKETAYLPPCHCAEMLIWAQWSRVAGSQPVLCQRLWYVKRKTWIIEPAEKLKHWADAGCQTCGVLVKAIRMAVPDVAHRRIKLSLCNFVPQLKVAVVSKASCEDRKTGKQVDVEYLFYLTHPKDYEGYQPFGTGTLPSFDQPRPGNITFHSEQAILRIQQWVRECLSDHPACNSGGYTPKRLLFLGDSSNFKQLCLIETLTGFSAPFVALSHCWGKTQHAITTKSNLGQRRCFISFEDLSRTFQDAIWITAKLGIRHLWIDSLCIVQDDPQDWRTEAANMYRLYAAAYLTLAASHGADGDAGVLPSTYDRASVLLTDVIIDLEGRRHDITMVLRPLIRIEQDSLAHKTFAADDNDDDSSGSYAISVEEPLTTRGWAFQERVLSTRIVHFTQQELIWECKVKRSCDCGMVNEKSTTAGLMGFSKQDIDLDRGVDMSIPIYRQPTDEESTILTLLHDPLKEWKRLISKYTARKLTQPSDRAAAFAGIAQTFRSIIYRHSLGHDIGDFCAGLWSRHLPDSLFWSCATDSVIKKPPSCLGSRIQNSTAPSWSWYSVTGVCSFFDRDNSYDYDDYGFRYLSISSNMCLDYLASTDDLTYGYLDGGILAVTNANLFTATRRSCKHPFHLRGLDGRVYESCIVHLIADDQADQDFVGDLSCLLLYSAYHSIPVYGWGGDDDLTIGRHSHFDQSEKPGELYYADPEAIIDMGAFAWDGDLFFDCREHIFGVALVTVGELSSKTYRRIGLFHAEGNSCIWPGRKYANFPVHRDDVPPNCTFDEDLKSSRFKTDKIFLV